MPWKRQKRGNMSNKNIKKVGFVCFGEVNTPFDRLQIKHDQAVELLTGMGIELIDAGLVVDDAAYKTADEAIAKLEAGKFSSLIICVAGWIPTHAVIRVTDQFRHPLVRSLLRLSL